MDSREVKVVDRVFNLVTDELDTVDLALKTIASLRGDLSQSEYVELEKRLGDRQSQLYAQIRVLHLIKNDVSFEAYCATETDILKQMQLCY